MTGAIASVACANGTIHHFVCVKKDGSLGHLIATFDTDDNPSWSVGDLTGQAHPQSRIAIGCPNPTESSPQIDVIYQNPSGGLEAKHRSASKEWHDEGTFSAGSGGNKIYEGTSLSVNYFQGDFIWCWQKYDNTIGIHLKDGTDVQLPPVAQYHFTTNGNTRHFYYLHSDNGSKQIGHFVSIGNSKIWDSRESQDVPAGTGAFKVVEETVSIIDVTKQDGSVTKSSVRLLESWLGEDFHGWSDFSGPDTLVAADAGLTVYARNTEKPSAFFTYVDSKSGSWIYLSVKQGQSVGYEKAIELSKGWFEASNPSTTQPTTGEGHLLGPGGTQTNGNDTGNIRSPQPHPSQPSAPVENKPAPTPAPEGNDDGFNIPEWTRKFCKDVLMPRASETINKLTRKSGDRLHTVFAPLDKLWNLGSEPLKYKFLDGRFGGNETQRQKVRDSIIEWTWYANITFQEAKKGETAAIKITFDPNDGSWSVVGNDAWKEDADSPTMNLGWVKGNSTTLPREERGVILHEFGHALGLLHEHQSPAHGGQSVADPDATIRFYMKDQGWTEDMVMDQVIRTYNLNDVSNFSEVDTKSIMHYYQPAEITGGAPIDYNYVLSPRDKAYMVINYPRSVADEKKNTQGAEVTLESALKTVGLTDDDLSLANKILAIRNNAGKDGIDVGQIRRLFTTWAKAKHSVKDEKLEPATRKYLRGVLEHQRGLDPQGKITLETSVPDPSPCGYSLESTPQVNDPKKARAVVDTSVFTQQKGFFRPDGDVKPTNFTWTIVNDPTKSNRVSGPWERKFVEDAMKLWTSACSVTFTWVEPGTASTADLVVVFQDINPFDGKLYDVDNSVNRSYFRPIRWTADEVKASDATLKSRQAAKWAPLATEADTKKAYWEAIRPAVPHDLCYRGIVTEKTSTNPPTGPKSWPPIYRSSRTVVHELGHFFGLDHENIGLWCRFWSDVEGKTKLLEAAKETNVNATIFDNASVMDALRMNGDGAERLHGWSRLGFKTVYAPSTIDISNLALYHAGPHLATANGDNKTFTLVNTAAGIPVISAHCAILGVSPEAVKELGDLAKKGQWSAIRKQYLAHQKKRVTDQAAVIANMTDKELAAARKIEPIKTVAHGQRMRFAGDNNAGTNPGGNSDDPNPVKAFDAPMPQLKEVLWSKLNELFGPSPHAASFLSIQSPARYLDKNEFSYKMEGVYSNFVKPVVVNEAEFRLTDQLFEPLRVVGAPNGQSLSTNYEMILNNLVPRYVAADIDIRKAREKMRSWLLEETSSQNAFFVNDTRIISPKGDGVVDTDEVREAVRSDDALSGPRIASRMEVCQKLMQEYLEASSAWKSKHSHMIQEAMHVQTDGRLQKLEDAAREIANTASVENSKLSAKYADVVVRGHLHTVRECLAQLDIKSTAEFLQDAKDSLRESALSSLYGASRVLPVIMTPMDWSESLDTSFDPQDLSSDPAIIEMNITAKTRQIDNLREQLSALQHNVKGDEASLRAAMDEASDKYSEAQAKLAGSYTESARLLATRIVRAAVPATAVADGITWAEGVTDPQKSSLTSMISKLDPAGTINELFEQMDKVSNAQRSMLSAGASFSQRQTDWVRAKSATTAEQEASVSRKIEAATTELESLHLQLTTARLTSDRRAAQLAKIDPEAATKNAAAMASGDPAQPLILPTMADIAPSATDTAPTAGSRWIALTITSKDAAEFKSSVVRTEVSRDDWGVSFFGLAAGGSGNTRSEGSTNTSAQSSNLDVEISMNCTMVTADRSSWFQPQFFGMSDAFMRNNNNVSWNQGWDEDWKKDTYKAVDAAVIGATKPLPDAFLPCFPTGYIIAKDVLIKISRFKIRNVGDKKYLDEKTTSGGSFLFFSTSKTTQKTEDSSSSAFQMASDGMIVRIPGPQVIGYIQQMLPYDGTHPFKMEEALRPDIFLPGDEVEPTRTPVEKGRSIGRGLDPNARSSINDKKKFTVRSTKPPVDTGNTESGDSSAGKPARAQAPKPKQPNGSGDVNGNGDAHEHDEDEMDHAMKLITSKLREKLNEPGFLEKLLSGK